MDSTPEKTSGLKQAILREVREMLVIFLYLAVFFCAFTTYRMLVMKGMDIAYYHYGFALLKALILSKVILLGRYARITKLFDDRPLIVPTFYKVILFSLFAMVFEVLEHVIGGWIHGKNLAGVFEEIMSTGREELLARTLMMVSAFIPFFAFGEITRLLGEGKLRALFFQKRPMKVP